MDKKALTKIHLSKATEDIARCEAFIKEQEERLQRLTKKGQDTTETVGFLLFLNGALKTIHEYRARLLQELDDKNH